MFTLRARWTDTHRWGKWWRNGLNFRYIWYSWAIWQRQRSVSIPRKGNLEKEISAWFEGMSTDNVGSEQECNRYVVRLEVDGVSASLLEMFISQQVVWYLSSPAMALWADEHMQYTSNEEGHSTKADLSSKSLLKKKIWVIKFVLRQKNVLYNYNKTHFCHFKPVVIVIARFFVILSCKKYKFPRIKSATFLPTKISSTTITN